MAFQPYIRILVVGILRNDPTTDGVGMGTQKFMIVEPGNLVMLYRQRLIHGFPRMK